MKEEHGLQKSKGRVLVMDDDEQIRNTAGTMLKKIGCEAIFAKDGTEAIKLYKRGLETGRPFDVVIMDLSIPGGMGGKESIKKLIKIHPDVNAIISSGEVGHPVVTDFRKYGFKNALPKPYNTKQLKNVLNMVLDDSGHSTVLVATEDEHFKERMLGVLDGKGHHSVVVNNCKSALQKI